MLKSFVISRKTNFQIEFHPPQLGRVPYSGLISDRHDTPFGTQRPVEGRSPILVRFSESFSNGPAPV